MPGAYRKPAENLRRTLHQALGDILDSSKPSTRPDLFSQTAQGPDHSKRILATLEHGGQAAAHATRAPAARFRLTRGAVLLGALAAFMAILAWLAFRSVTEPRLGKQLAIIERNAAVTESPQEVERMAAAIVNEPLQPAPAAATRPASRTAAAPLVPNRPAAPRKPARVKAATHAETQTAAADADVALLAALVAHSSSQPPAYARNRDVVERGESDSTKALLARCHRLGAAEGGLCRARICSGRWEHEAACRTSISY